MWRPEGWETVKPGMRTLKGKPLANTHVAFEAGADAMLTVLRARGHHVDRDAAFCSVAEHCTLSNKGNTGNYAFIPDEPEARP
jgi:hypothetical protein